MRQSVSHLKPILALPTYDGSAFNRAGIISYVREFPEGMIVEPSSSCLGHCFNIAYQMARREADEGRCTHFIMLHADVIPLTAEWGSILLEECETYKAGIVSAIIPIKTHEGLTSTAIEKQETQDNNGWHPIRFTMKEVFQMPETFTHPRLMLNTGLMVIDMRQAWTKGLYFDIQCHVKVDSYEPYFLPEDWLMSRYAQRNGASLYATRKVQVIHKGSAPYGNDKAWGAKASEGALEVFLHERT